MEHDLSISEAVSDPLIALMLRADGMEPNAFAEMLSRAAREQLEQKISRLREERATRFYQVLSAAEAVGTGCSHR
ncbi:MAG: hypothetical protein KJ947_07210 [Alphaproteobacteria bacterium]|jgi:hypothetical protein|nr:hypothetical protein [Alphaproteobacteria bacterium]MBU1549351.1 hypothetical protein [Alphaproteobacteria bacterium]MBU2338320.1 hypothetical protein [Alphaproteobacteria bacterium]MBU2388530.1 hypothetical protein [Alphaproteobacteria bacterium]